MRHFLRKMHHIQTYPILIRMMILEVLITALISSLTTANSYADNTRLNQHLLYNYDPRVRGASNLSEPTEIKISTYLMSIVEFDELKGKLSFVAYFILQWRDERIQWNISDYGGTEHTVLRQSDVWFPLITPSRTSDEFKHLGFNWLRVIFDVRGNAVWVPGDLFHSTCRPDTTKYPFDKQMCDIEFIFYRDGYGDRPTISVTATNDYVNLHLYTEHSQWSLQNAKSYVTVTMNNAINYHIALALKREYQFYLVGLVLPIALIGFLNVLVFFLPPESGERAGYSVTVLLALAVFLTIASDNLPKTSKPHAPLIFTKLFVDMLISGLVVLFSILGMRIYNMDPSNPVPIYLVTFTQCFLCKKRKRKIADKNMDKIDVNISLNTKQESVQSAEVDKESKDVYSITMSEDRKVTWTDVAKAFDIFFFLSSSLAFVLSHSVWLLLVN